MTLEQLKIEFPEITIYNKGKYTWNLFSGEMCLLTAEGLSLYLYLQSLYIKYRVRPPFTEQYEIEENRQNFIAVRDLFKKEYPKEYVILFKGVINDTEF